MEGVYESSSRKKFCGVVHGGRQFHVGCLRQTSQCFYYHRIDFGYFECQGGGYHLGSPPGKYELPSSNCQNDKFVNETGRDCGGIWLGADGTKSNPIVLAGSAPANPPEIYGTAVNSNYGIHVTGNYVVLENLKIHTFSKGVVFDNSVGALMEDCEVYHTGTELVHVRDSSQQVILSRNFIHGSGYEKPNMAKAFTLVRTLRVGLLRNSPTKPMAFGEKRPCGVMRSTATAATTGA